MSWVFPLWIFSSNSRTRGASRQLAADSRPCGRRKESQHAPTGSGSHCRPGPKNASRRIMRDATNADEEN